MKKFHTILLPLSFLFILLNICHIDAKTWYVSAQTDRNGWRLDGKGTKENPWDLQTALSGGTNMIKPGDTIYVRGGIYTGYFLFMADGKTIHAAQLYVSSLNGTEALPILVKAYPGEQPVLDGGPNTSLEAKKSDLEAHIKVPTAVLNILGSYTWYWGLEITNSSPIHQSFFENGDDLNYAEAVTVYESNHIKLINLIIHDGTGTGIAAFSHALNTEIEGCVIYYNGFTGLKSGNSKTGNGSPRKNGPGIYAQNTDDSSKHSKKIIKNNIVFEEMYNGLQIYGSKNAFVDNFDIIGNTIFNNGLLTYNDSAKTIIYGDYNLLLGGRKDAYNNRVFGNQFCFLTNFGVCNDLKIGYNENSSTHNSQIFDNYLISLIGNKNNGDPVILFHHPVSCSFNRNLIVSNEGQIRIWDSYLPTGPYKTDFLKHFQSDRNTYVYVHKPTNGDHFYISCQSPQNKNELRYYTLNRYNHQSPVDSIGQDLSSTEMNFSIFKTSEISHLKTIVTPDDFEPGLTKVVIFNWDSLVSIGLDLRKTVPLGNEIKLIDVQNFFGVPAFNGKYSGKINLKMRDLKASIPTGLKATPVMRQPDHTDMRFGVYWLYYFPYEVTLNETIGELFADFKDANGKEIKNPAFISYEWKINGRTLSDKNGSVLSKSVDGLYELVLTDDHGLKKTINAKVTRGKLSKP